MIGFSVIAESWSTYASVPIPFLTLPATLENRLLHIWSMFSLYSLKCLFFLEGSVFFLWGMKKSMPSRSCDQFPPASNSIHLLPRIDSIQLEVLSLLFQIWKICRPFLCSLFKSLVTFPLFSFRASCAHCHFPMCVLIWFFTSWATREAHQKIQKRLGKSWNRGTYAHLSKLFWVNFMLCKWEVGFIFPVIW